MANFCVSVVNLANRHNFYLRRSQAGLGLLRDVLLLLLVVVFLFFPLASTL